MKKPLAVLVGFVYFVPVSLFLIFYLILEDKLQGDLALGTFIVPILLMILACALVIVNMACALRAVIQSNCMPFQTVMLFKLCLIPFYIVNFICWMIGSMVFHLALVVWPMLPFIIVYTYFTMLGTSVHIIAKLLDLRRNKMITTKLFVIHSILQLTFTLDVLDSIYLTIKQKEFIRQEQGRETQVS